MIKINHKTHLTIVLVFFTTVLLSFVTIWPMKTYATVDPGCYEAGQSLKEIVCGDTVAQANTGVKDTSYDAIKSDKNCSGKLLTSDNCEIVSYIVRGINILSAIASLTIVGSIMVAGYQYMMAGGDPAKVQSARKRIVMAGTALLLFLFMYGLLNFLIPGGVL